MCSQMASKSNGPSLRFRAILPFVELWAAADAVMGRARSAAYQAAGGFLGTGLSPEDCNRLTLHLYDRDARTLAVRRRLFRWERDWLARRLPPPPARMLVGAAGAGAEVLHLSQLGYSADAFEPSQRAAALCREVVPPGSIVLSATFEEIADAVLGQEDGPGRALLTRHYDGVLLGWGGLTHVMHAGDRRRALEASVRLCPKGPILGSLWLDDGSIPMGIGRGREIGARLARAFGGSNSWGLDPTVLFGRQCGFGRVVSPAEIEDVAKALGRPLRWERDGEYGHFTLMP